MRELHEFEAGMAMVPGSFSSTEGAAADPETTVSVEPSVPEGTVAADSSTEVVQEDLAPPPSFHLSNAGDRDLCVQNTFYRSETRALRHEYYVRFSLSILCRF